MYWCGRLDSEKGPVLAVAGGGQLSPVGDIRSRGGLITLKIFTCFSVAN